MINKKVDIIFKINNKITYNFKKIENILCYKNKIILN